MSREQKWIPAQYQKNACFVSELGMPIIDLLALKRGEYILVRLRFSAIKPPILEHRFTNS